MPYQPRTSNERPLAVSRLGEARTHFIDVLN